MSWSLLMVMVPLTIFSLKMGREEQPTEHRELVFWLYQGSYFSFIEVFHGLVIPWQIDLQKVTKSSESPKGNPVDKDVQTCENCVQLRQLCCIRTDPNWWLSLGLAYKNIINFTKNYTRIWRKKLTTNLFTQNWYHLKQYHICAS